ncbi:MAG: tetratricopeptide repeat protein, partial [Bacteroidota bacterium]
ILDNNIAAVYIDKQEFSRAIALLEKLLKSKTVNNDSTTKARVLNNLGTAYFKQKNNKAVNYYIEALKIREALKNPVDLIASCLKLSDYYKDKNKDTFKAYAKRAYALASKINNREQKLSALSTLIDVTTGPEFEIYSKAYKVETEINNAIKASVKKEFAAMKYNYKNIEAQAAQNELKAQKDKLFLSILAMLAGLVFIISVFVNITQRGKHKKAKMEEAYKAESRISKKIHDELANEVFETLMFTDALQIDNLENKEILLKRLDKVYEKTRDISRENNSIDTSHNFYTLLIEMLARYKTEEINVLAVNTEVIAWDALDDHKKNTIYRVVQEFMVNMKKHSQATLVVVKFETDNKKLHISYVDNGVGITKNSFFHKNGLENAESRIKSINGTFTFDGVTKGVRISIIIPL